MRPRASALAAGFAFAFASVALAAPASAEHAPPPPLPVRDRQAPERDSDPLVRRPVEAHVAATTAWLGCSGSAPNVATVADPCASLSAAFGVEASLLYRPFSRASVGASAAVSRFTWDPSRVFATAPETRTGQGTWTMAGLVGRASFVDEGRLDPWIGGFAGVGFVTMRGAADAELTRVGFVTRGSVGLDVWLTGRLKATSQVEAAWQPGSSAERCENGTCLDGGSLARVPGRSLAAGLGFALALGDAM